MRKRALGLGAESETRKWNASPEWCSLCRQPMVSLNKHITADGTTHHALEIVFQTFVRDGNRRSFPFGVYRDAGLLSSPFASLMSLASFTEQDRRCRLFQVLLELKLPVFCQRNGWDDTSTCWTSGTYRCRRLGYESLRPVMARCIIGMFPKASSGVYSAYLEISSHMDNLEAVFHYLCLDSLFLAGLDRPWERYGRCNVVKGIGDNLKELLGKRPSHGVTAHQRVLATYALRSLAAEVVINKTEELVQRLESTWKELERPVDVMPTPEALTTMPPTNPMKERWDEVFGSSPRW